MMNDILQYRDYYASVHFSAADEVFYGKILAINDLVSFEGSSVKELKTAFEEAVEDYLATCNQLGRESAFTLAHKELLNQSLENDSQEIGPA